eukprot:scaffold22348_cov78-Skeletonema_dohrnii-CCMP3373.AAC.1
METVLGSHVTSDFRIFKNGFALSGFQSAAVQTAVKSNINTNTNHQAQLFTIIMPTYRNRCYLRREVSHGKVL